MHVSNGGCYSSVSEHVGCAHKTHDMPGKEKFTKSVGGCAYDDYVSWDLSTYWGD